jgi:diaminopropionate ammonia-lyase
MDVFFNPARADVLPEVGFGVDPSTPRAAHRSLPGYAPTPLREAPRIAARCGVARVLVKDEAQRLGLPSFKMLGASWAVLCAAREAWGQPDDGIPTLSRVRREIGSMGGRGLIAATDGNHGRGVARMARLLALDAHILVPTGTATARIEAIRSEGATVTVVQGTYDDAIVASAALADDHHIVVSDTSWDGYTRIPRTVIEGYATLFVESDEERRQAHYPEPDVVLLQAGVGAFAAAGILHFRAPGRRSPTIIVVEPESANCLMASARAGEITEVPGPHHSCMAGLNCGLPSPIAWPLLQAGADAFVTITDHDAEEGMKALAAEEIVAGESGAAGLAGLLTLASADPRAASKLGINSEATVLVVNTEGATDPLNYEAVVGPRRVETSRVI